MQAINPYLPLYEYIPDSEPRVFGDRLYVYGSHDLAGGERGFCAGDYMVWSAPLSDLGNWCCAGIAYARSDAPDLKGNNDALAAPDVVQGVDGRYYLYYNTRMNASCAVAVSDTPEGPFQFYGYVQTSDGIPYRKTKMFDPGVLVDDDKRVYLYTGFCPNASFQIPPQFAAFVPDYSNVTELEPDMITIKELPKPFIPGYKAAAGTCFEGHGIYEASSPRKINGKYVFVYSNELSHTLSYAISDYPDKDFIYMGDLISNGDFGLNSHDAPVAPYGNIHGGLVNLHGDWYIFYHRQTHAIGCCRQGCAEKLPIREDGWFGQAEVTSCGLNNGPLKAEGRYNACYCCSLTSPDILNRISQHRECRRELEPHIYEEQCPEDETKALHYIARITNGTCVGFKYFAFENTKNITVTLRGAGKGSVSIMLDSKDGKVVGIASVCGGEGWYDVTIPISVSGNHALYVRFDVTDTLQFQTIRFS